MNILLWSDSYAPHRGGIERMTELLGRRLATRGHSVHVVTSLPDASLPRIESRDAVTVHRFPFYEALFKNDLRAMAITLKEIAALKRVVQPAIIHLQLQSGTAFFHTQTSSACACPTVITIHGEFGNCGAGPETLLGKQLESAAWISAVSQTMLDDLHAIAPHTISRSSLIYNAVERHAVPDRPRQQPVVFACGRLVREKGFDLLLEAFHLLLPEMPSSRLEIAGDGVERESLERAAAQLGLGAAVTFLGHISDEALREKMSSAAVLAMPSRWREGFGLVSVEAAMLELPVVAARVGGLAEVIEHERTGVLVPPEDPVALKNALLDLLRSPEKRSEFGRAARLSAERRFDPDCMVDLYETMYGQALGARDSGL